MTRRKTPNDQAALDTIRTKLAAMPILAGDKPQPPQDGELAHLDADARQLELQTRRLRKARELGRPTGDDAA